MKRRQNILLLFFMMALVQIACYAPVTIPLTGSGATPAAPTSAAPFATTSPTGPCTHKVTFVSDVNLPDNTPVTAGQAFTKTWRVKNDGSCAWGPNGDLNALVFTGGYQMGAPEVIPLTQVVQPGQTVDVSVPLTAPATPGTYVSQWMFRINDPNAETKPLGVGDDGKGALYAQIVVK